MPVRNSIRLSSEQMAAVDLIEKTDDNYFITGRAGTGKSLILRYFKKNTKKKGVFVVAPTGIAAISVGGQTIHSFFGLKITLEDPAQTKFKELSDEDREKAKEINVIIIDEVSMVRADVMDMIDAKLRHIKESDLPFGGCQIIAFGDLYQLPPVTKEAYERDFLQTRYGTHYFFGAPAVKKTFKTIELHDVFRQTDPMFVDILSKIREGKASQDTIDYLNSHSGTAPMPPKCLTLTLRKDVASTINNKELNLLPGEITTFTAIPKGDQPPKENEAPCDLELKVKPGAKVMFIRNDKEGRFVNGTIGKIVQVDDSGIIATNGTKQFNVERAVWQKYKYEYDKGTKKIERVEVGRIEQYPVTLAYAITIHKSQGQTFDDVIVDYSTAGAFAPGQTYVALSRCRTLERMHLKVPLTVKDVFADSQIAEFLKLSSIAVPFPESASPTERSLYPHIGKIKEKFREYLPKFKGNIVRDDNAYLEESSDKMLWAKEALESKRSGLYVEACDLYFSNTLRMGKITLGWAKGIIKTLASSGDFADALAFGKEWYTRFSSSGHEEEEVTRQYFYLLQFIDRPETQQVFLQYLQSISGNPNYRIDLSHTDIRSDEVQQHVRENAHLASSFAFHRK